MANIAILYGTTEGQAAKIAHHIAALGRQRGHVTDVRHVAELEDSFDIARYDGAVVGASIHEGHHQRYVVRWLKEHGSAITRIPNAAFTVCLAIRSNNAEERAEAQAFSLLFEQRAGWKPNVSTVFAGALKYTQYNWLKRIVMKQISKHEGGSTDTSQDVEYTDWTQVDSFANELFDRVEKSRTR